MEKKSGSRQNVRTIGRICGWIAAGTLLLTLLTGYGITKFRIVTPLTLGLVNKVVSLHWHSYTDLPLIILLVFHIGLALWWRLSASKKKE